MTDRVLRYEVEECWIDGRPRWFLDAIVVGHGGGRCRVNLRSGGQDEMLRVRFKLLEDAMIPSAVVDSLPDVSVLNCGAGDMRFSFNPVDPLEAARAERVVVDMLARGYLLFAELDGRLQRVTGFDPATHEYVLADGPAPAVPGPVPVAQAAPGAAPERVTPEPCPRPVNPRTGKPDGRCQKGVRRGGRRVKAHGTKVTSVAPTAGG